MSYMVRFGRAGAGIRARDLSTYLLVVALLCCGLGGVGLAAGVAAAASSTVEPVSEPAVATGELVAVSCSSRDRTTVVTFGLDPRPQQR